MTSKSTVPNLEELRAKINPSYRRDETECVENLLAHMGAEGPFTEADEQAIAQRAAAWIKIVREHGSDRTLLEDFMQRYALSTDEGIALMGLAEALLRIPDTETADQLIVDKITTASWTSETHDHEKLITTLSGWGLVMSDHILHNTNSRIGRMVQRMGLPVIRQAVVQAVKLLGGQFVSGRTLDEALAYSRSGDAKKYLFSFDMLGEGARTDIKAKDYLAHYRQAIETVGQAQDKQKNLFAKHGVSIKLSALHPRYEESQRNRVLPIMVKRVKELILLAKDYDVPVTLDAEEAERLDLSLDIFEQIFTDPDLAGFNGFGLAIQAYQKRCIAVVQWLIALARSQGKKILVRLVKGAYWDSEIKKAQERGLSGYPVFTRKVNTDLSYLVAADQMLEAADAIYPQFATHNAFTISAILALGENYGNKNFEFQRLHGMGHPLYEALHEQKLKFIPPCRVYAPVGQHRDLLPYLVRRLLENGANSSFVNHIYDKTIPAEELAASPVTAAREYQPKYHPSIPLPAGLYPDRINSTIYDLSDRADQDHLVKELQIYREKHWQAQAFYQQDIPSIAVRSVMDPADPGHVVGQVHDTAHEAVHDVMQGLHKAFAPWNETPADKRAAILEQIAHGLLEHQDELIALCVYEAGKNLPDALAEIREAVDFCRYYAVEARRHAQPLSLPGPAGEQNMLLSEGRGVFVCISPWNFPLAIFIGQIAAALVTGNTVAAKPAPQTCLIAYRTIQIMLEAGLPKDVIALLPGDGMLGGLLVSHHHVAGIAFTGSTATARRIQKTLADKDGPIVPFIAETGGQNAMIVDSSALAEQVVDDVIRSGFHTAGQRCSALRVLYLQEEIAPTISNMLRGAMVELQIGHPSELQTDVGPVIDQAAQDRLEKHLDAIGVPLMQAHKATHRGYFVTPTVLGIKSIHDLENENFGPIVHIITYKQAEKNTLIDQINDYGYGLTLGVHSRLEPFIDDVIRRARVGNIYINRGITGAVVGVQPFGGMGLSGTGPKAGGPHYLSRFAQEKTVSINLTAIGGNATLASLNDGP
ncbi:MAG TPA: bifunctional proline dehydrogenase/L-glutamate gamma-semialdehyde dehydrogenase PutA [Alphaproteobacteria bacterium]